SWQHFDRDDRVILHDGVGDFGAGDHATECGISPIEMGLRGMGDEELAPAGIGSRERHPESSPQIPDPVDLVADCKARAALPIPAWIAALEDEVGDDAVPAGAVEEPSPGEREEVVHG